MTKRQLESMAVEFVKINTTWRRAAKQKVCIDVDFVSVRKIATSLVSNCISTTNVALNFTFVAVNL